MNEVTTRILDYLVLLFAVVLASSILFHLFNQSYETETAIYAEVSEFAAFQGVYIRSESVETYAGNGAVRYCVSDGAKLGVGSVIAEVYPNEEQIDLRRRIAEKEDELSLLEKVENPGTSEYAQPANLSTLIQERYKNMIRVRERSDYTALASNKREMTVLMSTYDKIVGRELNFTERMQTLRDEIAALTAKETVPTETIVADKSAYFVSYADGYEESLTPETMARLTPAELAAVTDNGTPAGGTHVIGKLVDGYAWYIAGVFDNTKLRLSEGDRATVRLETVSEPVTVTVDSLLSTGNIQETQVILRCERMTYDVVQHRTERVEILRETVEGIKVPRNAIRFKELTETVENEDGTSYEATTNYMGVYVRMGENAEFRKLEVVYEDEEQTYYLSKMDAGAGYLALYDDIIVNGVMADGG